MWDVLEDGSRVWHRVADDAYLANANAVAVVVLAVGGLMAFGALLAASRRPVPEAEEGDEPPRRTRAVAALLCFAIAFAHVFVMWSAALSESVIDLFALAFPVVGVWALAYRIDLRRAASGFVASFGAVLVAAAAFEHGLLKPARPMPVVIAGGELSVVADPPRRDPGIIIETLEPLFSEGSEPDSTRRGAGRTSSANPRRRRREA